MDLLEHDTGKSLKPVRLPYRNLAVESLRIRENVSLAQEIDNFEGNKGNKGNSLDSKGFERVTQARNRKGNKGNKWGNRGNKIPVLPCVT